MLSTRHIDPLRAHPQTQDRCQTVRIIQPPDQFHFLECLVWSNSLIPVLTIGNTKFQVVEYLLNVLKKGLIVQIPTESN